MNLWQGEQAFTSRPNKIVSIDGAAQRKVVGRKSLGDWKPEARGHDALATILAQNTIRDQRLLPLRHGRMAATPWTYYRGAAAVMAADLASSPNTGITVQLCGDAHVLNFGLWKTPNGTSHSTCVTSTRRSPARSNGTSSASSPAW